MSSNAPHGRYEGKFLNQKGHRSGTEDRRRFSREEAGQKPGTRRESEAAYREQRPNSAERSAHRSAPRSRQKQNKGVRVLLSVILTVSILAAVSAGGVLFWRFYVLQRDQDDLQKRAEYVDQFENTPEAEAVQPTLESVPGATEAIGPDVYYNHIAENNAAGGRAMLPKYVEMRQENQDLYGWIKVEDTRINYPVMQNLEDNEKYLHHNFSGEKSFAGIPFLDVHSNAASDQLLIYGHNMNDGSMFHDLTKYQSRDFWKAHPTIEFDTLYGEYTFEVMAVLYERVYYKSEDVFKFYNFFNAMDQEEYDQAVAYYLENSAYDTGVTAEYGDQLLALVTCAYHTEDGRFVVIAKKSA